MRDDFNLDVLDAKQNVIPTQIITDDRLSSDSRTFLLKAVYCIQNMGMRTMSKDDVFRVWGGLTEHRYRKVTSELRELGYLETSRGRSHGGRHYGKVGMTVRMPKVPSRNQPATEYLEILRKRKTPGQVNTLEINELTPENVAETQNPRSGQVVENQRVENQRVRNPRSGQVVENQRVAPDSPVTNEPYPHLVKSPSVPECLPPVNGKCSPEREVDEKSGKVSSFRREVEHARGHVLENCSEQQARQVFEMVSRKCRPGYEADQYALSRVAIDSLMEGSDLYRRIFMDVLRARCSGADNTSARPSYWLAVDYGPGVRDEAKSMEAGMASANCFS